MFPTRFPYRLSADSYAKVIAIMAQEIAASNPISPTGRDLPSQAADRLSASFMMVEARRVFWVLAMESEPVDPRL
jgi:hypothetical protein